VTSDTLTIAGKSYASGLIVGTGKYPGFEVMRRAIEYARQVRLIPAG